MPHGHESTTLVPALQPLSGCYMMGLHVPCQHNALIPNTLLVED